MGVNDPQPRRAGRHDTVAAMVIALLSVVGPLLAAQSDSTAAPTHGSPLLWPALLVIGFNLVLFVAWFIARTTHAKPTPAPAGMAKSGEDAHETTLLPLAVTRAVAIIEKRYADVLTVAGLAAEIRITPEYLERLFRESTGKAVADYVNEHRMDRAVELIKTTRLEISEIQLRVGIHDPGAFAELFRARTGMTAADYVREYRGVRKAEG